MIPMNKRVGATFVTVTLAFAATACGGDKNTLEKFSKEQNAPKAAAPVASSAAPPPPLPPTNLVKVEYTESDFAEGDRNRDPFRSFASSFILVTKQDSLVNQRAVVLPQFAIDELKLVAIVMAGDYPRAMLLDPQGKGWVLKRGDFLGRSEVVHLGGTNGTDYMLNWRVDRIRDGELVLIREDPAQPGIPPTSRILALHPEAEAKL
jgi:type IV pilus assembly protein PilP